MRSGRPHKPRPPLDSEALERLAFFYVGRYATTRHKLKAYLDRKLRERGWAGPGAADVGAVVARCADLGFVDDGAFAASRVSSLMRRGYGERRVAQALQAAGVEEADAEAARAEAEEQALAAALRFAERRRIGPYAAVPADRQGRQKAAAAMLRAGHRMDLVRTVLNASPGEIPDQDGY
ncbi:MAG: regulatory protein RecX [Allosphingosinicella sp.]